MDFQFPSLMSLHIVRNSVIHLLFISVPRFPRQTQITTLLCDVCVVRVGRTHGFCSRQVIHPLWFTLFKYFSCKFSSACKIFLVLHTCDLLRMSCIRLLQYCPLFTLPILVERLGCVFSFCFSSTTFLLQCFRLVARILRKSVIC